MKDTIEKERQTRKHRESELSAHLEETVAMLEKTIEDERQKRCVKHEEFVKDGWFSPLFFQCFLPSLLEAFL